MSDRKLRVAVIGAGGMANAVHLPSLVRIPECELVGLSDLDERRLVESAERHWIPVRSTNYVKMLEQSAPEAVYVILRPQHMFEVAVTCMKTGLHVFTEKPPGIHAQQTRQLAWWADRRGVLSMVGFNRRFIPLLVEARRQVESAGPIHQCAVTFHKNQVTETQYYDGAIDLLRCDAVHAVDVLRWLGGEVRSLASAVDRRAGVSYSNAHNALVRFDSGAVGILNTNWACGKRVHTFEMHSVGVSAYVDGNSKAVICRGEADVTELTAAGVAGSDEFRVYYGFKAQSEHFIRSILAGTQPQPSFEDSVKTMELCDRILASDLGGGIT